MVTEGERVKARTLLTSYGNPISETEFMEKLLNSVQTLIEGGGGGGPTGRGATLQEVEEDYTIPANQFMLSVDRVTIDSTKILTISSGSILRII